MYLFTHNAPPKVKDRPRSGKGRRLYTPVATLQAQAEFAASYEGPWLEGPLSIDMGFFPDRTQCRITEVGEGYRSPLRGDLDNYVKLVLDALQGVAFENDRQVVQFCASKHP